MSTPNPRRHPRGSSNTPQYAPHSPRDLMLHPPQRPISVEPKSEYLRNALEARRAKDVPAPPPSSIDSSQESRPASPSSTTGSVASTIDPWIDNAVLFEDDTPQITPIRRPSRPSDLGCSRRPTRQELESQAAKQKNMKFDFGLRLQLLQDANRKLQDELDLARKRNEELEPLNREVTDLVNENDNLKEKVEALSDENKGLQDSNDEILRIQEDAMAELEKRQTGLEEAADLIHQLEVEKLELMEENAKLKKDATQIYAAFDETSDFFDTDTGVSPSKKAPARIYSIDESRPSTSHFDSDYYSQPASPQVKPKPKSTPEVKTKRPFSDKFKDLHRLGRKSIQDIKKRSSDASLKNSQRPKSPEPTVPQIPAEYTSPVKPAKEIVIQQRRLRKMDMLSPSTMQEVNVKSPPVLSPHTPTNSGLRGYFHSESPHGKSLGAPYQTPPSTRGSSSSRRNIAETPPTRTSSRRAPTCFSDERFPSDIEQEMWDETSLPQMTETEDLISVSDFPTEDLPATADKERYWKALDKIYPNETPASVEDAKVSSPASRMALRTRDAAGVPNIFNAGESEDDFIQKTRHMDIKWPRRR